MSKVIIFIVIVSIWPLSMTTKAPIVALAAKITLGWKQRILKVEVSL
jgi:hypothetical protein